MCAEAAYPKAALCWPWQEAFLLRTLKGTAAQPVIDLIDGMFASDTTEILAFQRVAGNAHELDAPKASLSKLQARLSVTEDAARTES